MSNHLGRRNAEVELRREEMMGRTIHNDCPLQIDSFNEDPYFICTLDNKTCPYCGKDECSKYRSIKQKVLEEERDRDQVFCRFHL